MIPLSIQIVVEATSIPAVTSDVPMIPSVQGSFESSKLGSKKFRRTHADNVRSFHWAG